MKNYEMALESYMDCINKNENQITYNNIYAVGVNALMILHILSYKAFKFLTENFLIMLIIYIYLYHIDIWNDLILL